MKSTRMQTWAHGKVREALRKGTLTRKPCEVCNELPAQAHHDDYAKPLEVRWLCVSCHHAWHEEHGEALNVNAEPVYSERSARIVAGIQAYHQRPFSVPKRGGLPVIYNDLKLGKYK